MSNKNVLIVFSFSCMFLSLNSFAETENYTRLQIPTPPDASESTCGSSIDWQDVEQYDGNLGIYKLSRQFVDRREGAVGQVRWDTNLNARYTNAGNVNGVRWCSGTMISHNLFITAGHCFDPKANDGFGWDWPVDNGTGALISTNQAARDMHVNFNYQKNSTGVLQTETSYDVTSLVEYRINGMDFAILRLAGSPGLVWGVTRMAATNLTPDDELTIIQHPGGIPKVIDSGRYDGLETSGALAGYMRYAALDTAGGSSGSGVLDWQGRLVGVHTNAGCNTSASSANHGVPIIDIANISPNVSRLLRESGQYSPIVTHGDFNGDGYSDVAIGEPTFSIWSRSQRRGAGAVRVIYGNSRGLNLASEQIWHQNSPSIYGVAESGDHFGSSVASGDYNNDGYQDLAVGVAGEGIGSRDDAGMVTVIFGSASGLSGSQSFHQDSTGVLGKAEAGDEMGASVATGDFNNDGIDDLAVGVPGEAIGPLVHAGAVAVFYGTSVGLSASNDQLWHQNSKRIAGVAEAGDRFGESIISGDFNNDNYPDLAIGVPGEAIGSIQDAGAVNIIYGRATGLHSRRNQIIHQDVARFNGGAEAADRFGVSLSSGDYNRDGIDDLAIGVPGEAIGSITNAGAVQVVYGNTAGLLGSNDIIFHQNTARIPGGSEREDRFGISLASGDFNADGYDDLVIGVPGEAIGKINDAGAVNVLYGATAGLSGLRSKIWHQNSAGIPGVAEKEDRFGTALAAGRINRFRYEDLTISVVGEDWITTPEPNTAETLFGGTNGINAVGSVLY